MFHNLVEIQENILSWYAENGRDLPRRQTQDPYAIHISEVMLQQTQVDRVIPYFYKRLKKWPNYSALANASTAEILAYRSGLWFNSRALRLRECAKIYSNSSSSFKIEEGDVDVFELRKELMKLPGIGPYTSAAILSFAYNMEVPVIDTNIRRVLIFLFKLDEKISDRELENFAAKIIPEWHSRDRHNALMDYGALELTANKTWIKSKSKQSKFEGSDRQVRGWILKQLVKTPSSFPFKGENHLEIFSVKEEFPKKDVEKIIGSMVKDGLIMRDGDSLCLD